MSTMKPIILIILFVLGVSHLYAQSSSAPIPFNSAYSKHAQKAVSTYNDGLNQSNKDQIDFELGLTCSGIGLRITF